jgi:hypothetical protein
LGTLVGDSEGLRPPGPRPYRPDRAQKKARPPLDDGAALFGSRWQSEIAEALGVADRTVRRWSSGASPIPAGLAAELRAIVERRAEQLAELLRRLD